MIRHTLDDYRRAQAALGNPNTPDEIAECWLLGERDAWSVDQPAEDPDFCANQEVWNSTRFHKWTHAEKHAYADGWEKAMRECVLQDDYPTCPDCRFKCRPVSDSDPNGMLFECPECGNTIQ